MTEQDRYREVRRVLLLTLIGNIAVAGAKLAIGLVTGSLAMVADGFHSTLDATSNIIGLASITLAARPSSEEGEVQPEASAGHGAYLGIVGRTVSPEIAEAVNLPADQEGVLVEQVQQGSPADEAGLRGSYKPVTIQGQQMLVGGDVITSLDRQMLTGIESLLSVLQQCEPGQEVTLTLQRDGRDIRVDVTLGERPTS